MPAFPTGTKTFFNQTAAPTGWTKDTTNNDYTLRVISGTPSTTLNGSLNFSTTMSDSAWTATVSAVNASASSDAADLPAHTHTYTTSYGSSWMAYSFQNYPGGASYPFYTAPSTSVASGGGGSGATHTHTVTAPTSTFNGIGYASLNVQYLDFILATKN